MTLVLQRALARLLDPASATHPTRLRLWLPFMFALAVASLAGRAGAESPAGPPPPAPAQPELEIIFIPRADLPRAPGYDPTGVFLPLSELESLAAAALTPAGAASSPAPVSISGINLQGRLDLALELRGTIDYIAPSPGWSAALIDDGAISWTSQEPEAPTDASPTTPTLATNPAPEAYLAKVNGRTYLFALGPGRGRIAVEALMSPGPDTNLATLSFGRVFAPCYIDIELARHDELVSHSVPAEIYAGLNRARLGVWPAAATAADLMLRQALVLAGDTPLGLSVDREARAAGGGFQISDDVQIWGSFSPGDKVTIGAPPGLRLIESRPGAAVELRWADDRLTLTALGATPTLAFHAEFAVPLADGQAALAPWDFRADASWGALRLVSSEDSTVSLVEVPQGFMLSDARAGERAWKFSGPAPPVVARVSPRFPASAPTIDMALRLKGDGSVEAGAMIHQSLGPSEEMVVRLPEGWAPIEFAPGDSVPLTARRRSGGVWGLSWPAADTPVAQRAAIARLRHVTSWDAGTSATIRIPVLTVEGPRPERADWSVSWDESLETRLGALDQIEVLPPENDAANFDPSLAREARPNVESLRLRATGPAPSGELIVGARRPEARAVVVTALTLEDDNAEARALIRYSITRAGVGVFKFTLPKSAGADARIEAADTREMTRVDTPEGDLWTLTTQRPILGDYDVTVRWAIHPDSADETRYEMPRIQLPETPSQRGFLIVEGSEALRVRMEPRGLAEADLEELPALPWSGDRRALAVYRYVQPSFDLAIYAERVQPEPELEGLIPEAELITTLLAQGGRLTQARYTALPRGDRQFFELKLPAGAVLWSLLVNGRGEKPSRSADHAENVYLAPLPPAGGAPVEIVALYREPAPPLADTPRLNFNGPTPPFPVNRTIWKLNLPRGYEWLTFEGSLTEPRSERIPVASFLRTAYYPKMIVFDTWSPMKVAILCGIALGVALIVRRGLRQRQERKLIFEPEPQEPKGRGCGVTLVEVFIVLLIILILSAIAVPNFLEAQVRSKVSRVKADQRSLATAVESYAVDYQVYPDKQDRLWQGSIKFINQPFTDPFDPNPGTTLRYLATAEIQAIASELQPEHQLASWLVYSVGPDGRDDRARITYDPTNGTTSAGDIIRTNQGFFSDKRESAAVGMAITETEDSPAAAAAPAEAPAAEPAREPAAPQAQEAPKSALSDEQMKQVQDVIEERARQLTDQESAGAREEAQKRIAQLERNIDGLSAAGRENEPASAPESRAPSLDGKSDTAAAWRDDDGDGRAAGFRGGPGDAVVGDKKPEADQNFRFSEGEESDREAGADGPAGAGQARTFFAADGAVDKTRTITLFASGERAARDAGLLSLSIEMPEGGKQRVFEGLTGEARMETRVIDDKTFKRVRFLVWILLASALGAVFIRRPSLYGRAFTLGVAVTLLGPIVIGGASPAWFNAAFQGVIFSLVVPAVVRLYRRMTNSGTPPPPNGKSGAGGAAMFLLMFAAASGSMNARALEGDAPAPPATIELKKTVRPAPSPAPPARIIVPYDAAQPPYDGFTTSTLTLDPIAFMSQSDFTRLWNLTHPDPRWDERPNAAVTSLSLDGLFDSESRLIRGMLLVTAINPQDVPAVIDLVDGQVQLESADPSVDPGGGARATLQVNDAGRLQLRADARWSGTLRASIALSPSVTGFSGALRLNFAEAAAGILRFTFPYVDLDARITGGAPLLESREGRTIIAAPVRPGAFDLNWTASAAPSPAESAGVWRANVDWNFNWDNLAFGFWTANIDLKSEPSNAPLPRQIALTLPAAMRLVRIDGPGVESASINAATLRVSIRPATQTAFLLTGVAFPAEGAWPIGGFEAAAAARVHSTVSLALAPELSMAEFKPEGLRRVSTGSGAGIQRYESLGSNWSAGLRINPLRPVFDAKLEETVRPREGFLFRASRLEISLSAGALRELALRLPPRTRVTRVEGDNLASWSVEGERLSVILADPSTAKWALTISSVSEAGGELGEIHVTPLEPIDARATEAVLGIVPPEDQELEEAQIPSGARPVPPTETLRSLSGEGAQAAAGAAIRAYAISGPGELVFRLRPVDARALLTVVNLTVIEEGLRRLTATVRVEPRKGRVSKVILNALHGDAAPDEIRRIHAEGPVRATTIEPVSPGLSKVVVELSAPRAEPFTLRLTLERPASVEQNPRWTPVSLAAAAGSGGRSFVVLRRALEGELRVEDAAGARPIDPAEALAAARIDQPARPSDLAFELAAAARPPAFSLVRHAREDALRAIVEILRQTTTISEDGFERHELELYLQNQSEQFLKIALPAPADRIALYEVRVADRVRRASFGVEDGRDVLLVPLIRTGLLDPELVVRVAYTISGREPLSARGEREQRLPDVLGGVPVLQSQLILRLPGSFRYSDFDGQLEQIDLVDIETADALRLARNIGKVSEVALNAGYETQAKAVGKLQEYMKRSASAISTAKQMDELSRARRDESAAKDSKHDAGKAKLAKERAQQLNEAVRAQNLSQENLTKIEGAQAQFAIERKKSADIPQRSDIAPPPPPSTPEAPPVSFPSSGQALAFETFAFRQLQGTGAIHFESTPRRASQRFLDAMAALGAGALAAAAFRYGRRILASRREAGVALIVIGGVAAALGALLDLAFPILAVGLFLALTRGRHDQ